MVAAVNGVHRVTYAEIVATISNKSAGPGTQANIDEFTETTAKTLEVVVGADKGKAIIILNPADPPILMQDTFYILLEEGIAVDQVAITKAVRAKEAEIQAYVPDYRLRQIPSLTTIKSPCLWKLNGPAITYQCMQVTWIS